MEMLLLLFAAVLPGIILLIYIKKKDAVNPEPQNQMLKAFGYGCLSVIIAMAVELVFEQAVSSMADSMLKGVLTAFCVAAIPEEAAKLFCLWRFFKKCKFYDEYLDGIVYSVCVGLGFATIENIGYLIGTGDWLITGIFRGVFSVPGHYAFAIIMGYYYSLYHFDKYHNEKYKSMILVAPVIAHGIYDSLLMVVPSAPGFISVVLVVAFLYFNRKMHKFCSAKIEDLQQRDQADPFVSLRQ